MKLIVDKQKLSVFSKCHLTAKDLTLRCGAINYVNDVGVMSKSETSSE